MERTGDASVDTAISVLRGTVRPASEEFHAAIRELLINAEYGSHHQRHLCIDEALVYTSVQTASFCNP
ncbi:hypothetical protein E2C01_042133 [Portunus trituberculatus]|uniref:Uncharacterized protein n=1 Tax=Portunus trituberculatus TaxID=210409 RepID=A0A5B7FTT5_PORTR|nr:hypothetical protein [Portunus trituberculatus]